MAAYELLVAAGSSLMGTEIFAADTEPSDGNTVEFLSANMEALDRAREALRRNCVVPLEYDAGFFEKHSQDYSPLRDLARSFALELNATARLGDFGRATDIGLNIFDLANAVRRGGLVVDSLVAVAIEGIAMDRLRGYRLRLNPNEATHLANELLRIDAEREPFEEIVARDHKWEEAVESLEDDTDFLNTEWPVTDEDGIDQETGQAVREMLQSFAELPDDHRRAFEKQIDDRNIAMMRLLALESGLIACHARDGVYPSNLSRLVPDCIAALPTDPFTGAEFKYRKKDTGFMVYSPGPTGQDSGGNFGGWFSILAGEADLGVDMCDYENACCIVNPCPTLISRFVAFVGGVFRR